MGGWFHYEVTGEGCFFVFVSKSSTHALGHKVQLVFQITQHSRDIELIRSFITYFGCGRLAKSEFDELLSSSKMVGHLPATTSGRKSKVQYRVEGFSSNYDIIREFFINHNIRGVKSQDFKD
jgi:hypothetical protein